MADAHPRHSRRLRSLWRRIPHVADAHGGAGRRRDDRGAAAAARAVDRAAPRLAMPRRGRSAEGARA
eukprot:3200632-Prymnesium_polylepis.1